MSSDSGSQSNTSGSDVSEEEEEEATQAPSVPVSLTQQELLEVSVLIYHLICFGA
jgi:hypothetical protein